MLYQNINSQFKMQKRQTEVIDTKKFRLYTLSCTSKIFCCKWLLR